MSGSARAWVSLCLVAIWSGSALPAGDDRPQRRGNTAGSVRKNIRDLRRAAMRPPSTQRRDGDLQRAIKTLKVLQFPPKGKRAREGAPSRPAASQPASAPAGKRFRRPTGPLTPAALEQMVKRPAKDMVNAAALADALFLAGRPEAACGFYELVLKSEEVAENKAWLLYQIGNCRRACDPPSARQFYKRLLTEHPNSPWRPLAEVQDHLNEWYQVNKPAEALAEMKIDE